jgi:hypothetical protein
MTPATKRMKEQAECSLMMAIEDCLTSIDSGNVQSAQTLARTCARYAFMLNAGLRPRLR